MEALEVDGFCQDIMQLDANQLVAQVRAARDNREAQTTLIRRGALAWAEEVECLLERVATETLGLTAQRSDGLDLKDEMDACPST
jgi:chromosome condensin MukBEF MukE localization factor